MIERRFRAAVTIASGLWCCLILAAPLLREPSLYAIFSAICHQQATRSWHVWGEPFAVCIRCSSIYCGFFFGSLLSRRPNADLLRLAMGMTVAEFIIARAFVDSPWLRAPSGTFLGFAAAPFVILGVQEMFEMRFRHAAM
jgi:uncharacterized membrane protein